MKRIPLTKGMFALVDDEDFERVSRLRWHAERAGCNSGIWYARHDDRIDSKNKTTIFLHRFVINAPNGMFVDHANRDGLDCRKSNLRVCTRAQNQSNRKLNANSTTGYKGVYFDPRRPIRPWSSKIAFNGRSIFLGSFETKELAAKQYNRAALKYHRHFARLNRISEDA